MVTRNSPVRLAVGGLVVALTLAPAVLRAAPIHPLRGYPGTTTPVAVAQGRAASGTVANAPPVTLSLRDTPLRTALQMLFEGSGLQHAVEPAVPNYPITLDIRDVPFNTALRTLLRLAPSVTYRKEGDVYIVGMRQAQVEQPTANEVNPQPEQTPAVAQLQWEKVPLSYTHSSVIGYAMGATPIPSEVDILGGGIGGLGGTHAQLQERQALLR